MDQNRQCRRDAPSEHRRTGELQKGEKRRHLSHAPLARRQDGSQRTIQRLIGSQQKIIDALPTALALQRISKCTHLAEISLTDELRFGLDVGELFQSFKIGRPMKRKIELRGIEHVQEDYIVIAVAKMLQA